MRMRISQMTTVPKMVSVWHGKLEEAEVESGETNAHILEFGSVVAAADGRKTTVSWTDSATHGGWRVFMVHPRQHAHKRLQPVIERVTIDCSPEVKDPERPIDTLTEANRVKDDRLAYVL